MTNTTKTPTTHEIKAQADRARAEMRKLTEMCRSLPKGARDLLQRRTSDGLVADACYIAGCK